MFKVCVLGSSSAMPMFGRGLPAHVLLHDSGTYLIDCGEGTQFQLQRFKIKLKKLKAVFITHTHGDHSLGLPGLLSTLSMLERIEPLHIFCPLGLHEWVQQFLKLSDSELKYPIEWHPIPQCNQKTLIYESEKLDVYAFPLLHRVACNGFFFQEKNKSRRLNIEKLKSTPLPKEYYSAIKNGKNVLWDNITYNSMEYTLDPAPAHSYAYVSDTVYHESLAEHITNVELMYHEATFLELNKDKALQTFHSTAYQAAQQARNVRAKHLLLGHFSARYYDLTPLLLEAQSVFPNTLLAQEGKFYDLTKMDEIYAEYHRNSNTDSSELKDI